ncbi:MAG: recombination-associated protein RdgC [Burkholderiaceae bacterium]|jgi:recombination associated protein RdgC|nr:recombination-associated protein RdgC [Burkholderiaceae bacterium]
MWFKNLKLFRLSNTWNWTAEQIDTFLVKERFVSPGAAAPTASGWTPPREEDVRFAYTVNRQILCAFRSEKKLLPASVINQFVKQRAIELEEQQGFKPGRKQLRDLKEEVTNALIPRAFSLTRDTRVWIDPINHWLVIDTASASKAEEILSALGKAIYPFPVEPIQVTLSPAAAMTQWLTSSEAPANFTIDQDAELRAGGDKAAAIRYVKHALDSVDIEKHIQSGKQCTRLALTWHDKVSFVLTETLDVKRVVPQDILDEAEQLVPANEAEKFDGEFALMCAELNVLLAGLLEALEEKKLATKAA